MTLSDVLLVTGLDVFRPGTSAEHVTLLPSSLWVTFKVTVDTVTYVVRDATLSCALLTSMTSAGDVVSVGYVSTW